MSDFQLGQRVAYSTHLRRRYNDSGERARGKLGKEWSTTAYGEVLLPGGEGVIVGRRTLSNGNVSYYGDGSPEYTSKVTFTAYLVAYDLRRSPVFVMPDHITALD